MNIARLLQVILLTLSVVSCSSTQVGHALDRSTGSFNVLQEIEFAPDGTFLAASGFAGNNYVEFYEVRSLNLIKTFNRRPNELWSPARMAFSPDGKLLTTSGTDDPMITWNIQTGEELIRFANFTSVSEAITAPDGRITNLSTLRIVWQTAYSPDGALLATAGPKNRSHIFESATGHELAVLSGHTNDVRCLAFSKSGKLMATGGSDGMVLIWDVASRKIIAKTKRHKSRVTSLSFSIDGKTLLSTDYHQALFWTLASIDASEQGVESESSRVLEGNNQNGAITLSISETIDLPESPMVTKGQYSPDGRYVAIKSYNEGRYTSFDTYQIKIINLATKETHTIKGTYLDFAFSPDGELLATAGRGVKLWSPALGKEVSIK